MAGKKESFGCARPTGRPVGSSDETPDDEERVAQDNKGGKSMLQVGQKAADFGAPAYFNGEFISVKLSDYLGKWVSLCFYPGDFTFV